MRKLFLLIPLAVILAAGGLLAGAAAWQRSQPQGYAPRGPGDIYLALGDSLAWGASLDQPAAESYPALIHAALAGQRPIELANLGFPGETSGSLLRGQLSRALDLIARARREGRRVSPITVGIGGNDLRAVERGGPDERSAAVAAVASNLGQALDQLRAAAPDADIAVMTYYNPYGGDPAVENSEAYWVGRLNLAISQEAGRRGAAVADVYAALDGGRAYTHTFILLGDVHANARGHRLIAESFRAALGYP